MIIDKYWGGCYSLRLLRGKGLPYFLQYPISQFKYILILKAEYFIAQVC